MAFLSCLTYGSYVCLCFPSPLIENKDAPKYLRGIQLKECMEQFARFSIGHHDICDNASSDDAINEACSNYDEYFNSGFCLGIELYCCH